MENTAPLDQLVELYQRAAKERQDGLMKFVLEAVAEHSTAEGAEAFAAEAMKLASNEAAIAETSAAEAAEAGVAEATAFAAQEFSVAEAMAGEAAEASIAEGMALEAGEAIAAEAGIAEALSMKAAETSQTYNAFLSKL